MHDLVLRAAAVYMPRGPRPGAVAVAGVTTIIDMPLNSIPSTTTPEALEIKRKAAHEVRSVDVGFWGGAVPQNLGRRRRRRSPRSRT
jgi:dihydroorotase-like cyclic amidohydrolase